MSKPQAIITGLGSYLPEQRLTNADIEKLVETSNEWIVTRTGIEERRIAGADEFSSTMGAKAAKIALEHANLAAGDVEAIVVSTMTPDYLCPSTAALIQHEIKANKACAIDVQAACSGFLYALSIAKAWVQSGMYRNVLVIATEKNSAFIDYQDRGTCPLFGDGAGAVVVQSEGSGYLIRDTILGADGELGQLLYIPASGCRMPATEKTIAERQHYMKMYGQELFKHAVRRMESAAKECLEKAGLKEEELNWLIPHQANIRIIEAMGKRFNLPWERVFRTIHKYGNTSSSTVPIALQELDATQTPNPGENILLVAFGGGLTWGATLLTKVTT